MRKWPEQSTADTHQDVYDLDRRYVFHSWSAQATLDPLVIAGASGSEVWDFDGKVYLDFSSQLVNTNIGHQHPKIVDAIKRQAEVLCTIAPQHANDRRGEAAQRIVSLAPGSFSKVFFTNGGAEAVEYAIRLARLHTGRPKILSAYRSYHGGTGTAVNVTGDPRRWPNELASAGNFARFFGPYLYRSHFNSANVQEEGERALRHLEETVQFEGPCTIAAIMLESIPGTAGIMVPPPMYLAGVREICDRYGILLILDEVMAGFGRTGAWFAFDHFNVVPDLITFAKGVTSGYVPLGGVILSESVAEAFDERVFPGGLTYSGHPLACAAAVASIDVMHEENILENAQSVGADVIGPSLAEMAQRHPSVGDVRGLGVFWAVELVRDRETREPLAPYGGSSAAMSAVRLACLENGILPFINFNRIHVVPPCTITADEARRGLRALDAALSVADEFTATGIQE